MILDELVLDNVGTFGGRHVLTLTPPTDQQPIILIGGLNGAGKTTILESIHLALFGSLAQSSQRRAGGYDGYLRRLIHHRANASQGARVELRFHTHHNGERHDYRVCRKWRTAGKGVTETLVVFLDEVFDQALTATWTDFVETILPRGVAGLFFFDGEQIEALADMKRSQEVLGSALSALLGLELVDRLQADLKVLKRRHRPEDVPEEIRRAVEDKKATVTAIRHEEAAARELEASARVEAERAAKNAFEIGERFRTAGGELAQKRDEAEHDSATLKEQIVIIEADMRAEMAGIAPLLLVADMFTSMTQQAVLEQRAARSATVLEALSDRDRQLVDLLASAKVGVEARAQVEAFLSTDREQRDSVARIERIVGLEDAGSLAALRDEGLGAAKERLATLAERRHALLDQRVGLERVLVAMPDSEAIDGIKGHYQDALSAEQVAQARLVAATERLGAVRADRSKADTAYEKALDVAADAGLNADDERRMITHLERVTETLETLRVAAAGRHVERIAARVLESLNVLLRKNDLITAVGIDAETKRVSLVAPDGRDVEAVDLSAGERQLLAVALLWGLARAAGRPLPMVIDTPLGRLDGAHREHLLERYFPYASHQVLLLSTDTEIDENALKRIRPFVGRAYTLSYDAQTKATCIDDGYFWETL